MGETLTINFILYGLVPILFIGFIYFWNNQRIQNKIQFEFNNLRSDIYHIRNGVEFFKVYNDVMVWNKKLFHVSHEPLRRELFQLLNERKIQLNIKSNYKIN
jgi:hypothetical protein